MVCIQIHLMAGGAVRIFSRNCEDRTPSFPDVADIVRAAAAGERPLHSGAVTGSLALHVRHCMQQSPAMKPGTTLGLPTLLLLGRSCQRAAVILLTCRCCAGGATTAVLDAELVAVDRADGNRFRAFQELSTRARGKVDSHEVRQH